MKRYKLKNFKLSATVKRDGKDLYLDGTFGPFEFNAIARECIHCHHYDVSNVTAWLIKGERGHRAFNNALYAIGDRLEKAQVPTLRQGEQTRINL